MKKIKVVSLFSGIGGFERGITESLGDSAEVVFASEIDKYASKSYEILHGLRPHGDITQIEAKDIPDHDVLVGGFPCQAFSISGKRQGFADTRGTLFFEIARIIKEKQTPYIILENVKGLLNHDKGKTFETIKGVLEDLGYTIHTKVLNSKYFGVAQNRERIFITGKLNDPTFHYEFPSETLSKIVLKDILEESVEDKYYLSEERTKTFIPKETNRDIKTVGKINESQRGHVYNPEGIIGCLTASDYKDPKIIITGNIKDSFESLSRVYDKEGIAPTLTTNPAYTKIKVEGYIDNKHKDKDMYRVMGTDGISPTLTKGGSQHRLIKEEIRIRRITPTESFRLQSFPDEWIHRLRENGISNTQLYKMAGNAVTSNVIKALVDNLKGEWLDVPQEINETQENKE